MPSHNVSVQDAKHNLLDLIKLVHQGDEVVIIGEDGSHYRLIPSDQLQSQRVAGLCRGKVHMSDDFDAPLDDHFLMGDDH